MAGPIIAGKRPVLQGLFAVVCVFFCCMFFDPRATRAFENKLPWLGIVFGWVRHLLHLLGW